MPREIHTQFFTMFGVLLGALYGFVFSVWMPTREAIIVDLYNPVMWAIAILSFFILQYGLSILLNKPSMSREIYFGIFLIPITYTSSLITISIPNFLQTLIAVEVPALVLFMALFYLVSPFTTFFAGFDTTVLDETKIPAETVFSFAIHHSTVEGEGVLKLFTRILRRMELTVLLRNMKDHDGLIICRKEKLHVGIFYEVKDRVLTATFIPFRIVNDTVKEVEDSNAILDFKAQISGMLYAWMQNNLVRFNEVLPNLKLGLEKVSEGLGPSKGPPITHLSETIFSFPKYHPYRFAFFTSGLVIIVNVMLFILGKLVLK